MSDYLPVGTRVTFSGLDILRQAYAEQEDVKGYLRWVKRWKRMRETYPRAKDGDPQTGVIVGVRIKRTGYVLYGYGEEPATFVPIESHRVYLVAYELFKDPAVLLIEDVQPEAVDSPEPNEMPYARADECPHAGLGKACKSCRMKFDDVAIAARSLLRLVHDEPGRLAGDLNEDDEIERLWENLRRSLHAGGSHG